LLNTDKTAVLAVVLVSLLGLILFSYVLVATLSSSEKIYAGFRCNGESTPEYWVGVAKRYAALVPDTSPGGLWIIPESKVLNFDAVTDSALTVLDNNGVKVLLSVGEGPGEPIQYTSSIDDLIDATLSKYGNHPSVLGYVVEVEFRGPSFDVFVPVTDAEAQRWVNKIKGYNPNFKLFLKHWDQAVMPPTVRDGIVFIDDANGFGDLDSMVSQFKQWGDIFSQADVGFQIGYEKDEWWWFKLTNPPKDIGSTMLENVTNCRFILWVNFTVDKVFPFT
jgi:hypothetical protein